MPNSPTRSVAAPARIAANRENAQKSTGPRTDEGKARSSRNATRHGLYARDVIVTKGDFPEDAADFERLQNDLIEEFDPAGPLEQTLVERLAVSFWRLRRAYRFEVRAIGVCREHSPSAFRTSPANYKAFAARPRDEPLPLKQDVDTLVRYESMIDREIHRTLNQLQSLRKTAQRSPPSHDTPDTPGEDIQSPKRQRGVSAAPPSPRANPVGSHAIANSSPIGRTSVARDFNPRTQVSPMCISRPAGGRILRATAGRAPNTGSLRKTSVFPLSHPSQSPRIAIPSMRSIDAHGVPIPASSRPCTHHPCRHRPLSAQVTYQHEIRPRSTVRENRRRTPPITICGEAKRKHLQLSIDVEDRFVLDLGAGETYNRPNGHFVPTPDPGSREGPLFQSRHG